MSLTVESYGTKTADGTEQTLFEDTTPNFGVYEGDVDLSNMAHGDSVTITPYKKVLSTGGWVVVGTPATLANAQGSRMTYVPPHQAPYGWKITLQQHTGPYRDFDWHVTSYQKN